MAIKTLRDNPYDKFSDVADYTQPKDDNEVLKQMGIVAGGSAAGVGAYKGARGLRAKMNAPYRTPESPLNRPTRFQAPVNRSKPAPFTVDKATGNRVGFDPEATRQVETLRRQAVADKQVSNNKRTATVRANKEAAATEVANRTMAHSETQLGKQALLNAQVEQLNSHLQSLSGDNSPAAVKARENITGRIATAQAELDNIRVNPEVDSPNVQGAKSKQTLRGTAAGAEASLRDGTRAGIRGAAEEMGRAARDVVDGASKGYGLDAPKYNQPDVSASETPVGSGKTKVETLKDTLRSGGAKVKGAVAGAKARVKGAATSTKGAATAVKGAGVTKGRVAGLAGLALVPGMVGRYNEIAAAEGPEAANSWAADTAAEMAKSTVGMDDNTLGNARRNLDEQFSKNNPKTALEWADTYLRSAVMTGGDYVKDLGVGLAGAATNSVKALSSGIHDMTGGRLGGKYSYADPFDFTRKGGEQPGPVADGTAVNEAGLAAQRSGTDALNAAQDKAEADYAARRGLMQKQMEAGSPAFAASDRRPVTAFNNEADGTRTLRFGRNGELSYAPVGEGPDGFQARHEASLRAGAYDKLSPEQEAARIKQGEESNARVERGTEAIRSLRAANLKVSPEALTYLDAGYSSKEAEALGQKDREVNADKASKAATLAEAKRSNDINNQFRILAEQRAQAGDKRAQDQAARESLEKVFSEDPNVKQAYRVNAMREWSNDPHGVGGTVARTMAMRELNQKLSEEFGVFDYIGSLFTGKGLKPAEGDFDALKSAGFTYGRAPLGAALRDPNGNYVYLDKLSPEVRQVLAEMMKQ